MDNSQDRQQDGVELSEAAEIMGMSTEALRKRIQRGKEKGYKVDGRWYVVLPRQYRTIHNDSDENEHYTDSPDDKSDTDKTRQDKIPDIVHDYIDDLRNQIEFLKSELHKRSEEIERKDELIENMLLTITGKDRTIGLLAEKIQLPAPNQEVAATEESVSKKRRWWQRKG